MLKNHQTRRIYGSRQYHVATSLGFSILTFLFAFITSFLIGSHFAPVSDGSASSDISTFLDSETGYYLSTTSLGNVILDVVSTPSGQTVVGKDTLTTKTNSSTGYKLYISMDKSAEDDRNGNRLYRNGDSSSGYYLSPSTGAITSPLKLATNTWGYALGSSVTIPAGTMVAITSGTNTSTTTLTDPLTIPAYTGSTGTIEADAADTALFMAVPLRGNESLIQSYDQASSTGVPIDVYYGVNANTALPSGLYTGTVYYTAIAEGEPAASGEVSVSPTIGGISDTLTIATGLYTTMEDIGDVSITIGGVDCKDITRINPSSTLVSFTCTVPMLAPGSYTVEVNIPKFGKTYTLENGFTIETPRFYTITTMQEMTHDICQDASVVTPAADATLALSKDNYKDENGNLVAGIPTTTLLDDRAGQVSYTVKKLADGKCWMTENLALPSGAVLTAADSDLDGTVVTSYTVPVSSYPFSGNLDNNQMNDQYTDITTEDPRGYKNGNYYSWRSATAGTGRGSGTSGGAANDVFGTDMNTSGNNTLVSICPKGWRLPTGGDGGGTNGVTAPGSTTNLVNGDFQVLYAAYGGTDTSVSDLTVFNWMTGIAYGPNLSLVGGIYTGSHAYEGQYGYFLSSTVYGSPYVYKLNLGAPDAIKVNPQSKDQKNFGLSVRCVAR